MNTINLEILINNIFNLLLFLIIFGIITLISMKGLNTIFVKTKEGVNKGKSALNDRLTNINIELNPKLFDFLVKIQKVLKNKYIFVFIISITLIILWFYIFHRLLTNYFNDSEVMKYEGNDYNIKHLFDSIYSNFEKSKWLNYSENNYISENGKLCTLSPVHLDSCIGSMINNANNLIFTKNGRITPEFTKNGRLSRLQKIYDDNKNIYIIGISGDMLDINNMESKPNKIQKILYNENKLILENEIKDMLNDNNSIDLIDIDDPRILFPLKKGYLFDIKFKDLRDNIYNPSANLEDLFKKNRYNNFYNLDILFIKCKILNIDINENTYHLSRLELEVYNDEARQYKYKKFKIYKNVKPDLNFNSLHISSARIYFKTSPYLNHNLKVDEELENFEKRRKKYERKKVNEDNDFSNILAEDKDEDEDNTPGKDTFCIAYQNFNDIPKGSIVKIMDDRVDGKYNVKVLDTNNNKYMEEDYIGRDYLLCHDLSKNKLYAKDLFKYNCLQKQENKNLNSKDENDPNRYGCK